MKNTQKDPLQEMVNKWVEAAYAGQTIDEAEFDQFRQLLDETYKYTSFYDSEWPGFKGTGELSIVSVDDCIEAGWGLEGDELVEEFRGRMACESDTFYFLKGVTADDGRWACIVVHCVIMGQLGPVQTMEAVVTSGLEAEQYLRDCGYLLTEGTLSGKADTFTDEEIIELVRKARESEKQH